MYFDHAEIVLLKKLLLDLNVTDCFKIKVNAHFIFYRFATGLQ